MCVLVSSTQTVTNCTSYKNTCPYHLDTMQIFFFVYEAFNFGVPLYAFFHLGLATLTNMHVDTAMRPCGTKFCKNNLSFWNWLYMQYYQSNPDAL